PHAAPAPAEGGRRTASGRSPGGRRKAACRVCSWPQGRPRQRTEANLRPSSDMTEGLRKVVLLPLKQECHRTDPIESQRNAIDMNRIYWYLLVLISISPREE